MHISNYKHLVEAQLVPLCKDEGILRSTGQYPDNALIHSMVEQLDNVPVENKLSVTQVMITHAAITAVPQLVARVNELFDKFKRLESAVTQLRYGNISAEKLMGILDSIEPE